MASPRATKMRRQEEQDSVAANTSLKKWLNVAWFFPVGFKRQEVIETPDSFLCYGTEQIYKFPKDYFHRKDRFYSFDERWSAAVKEVLTNAQVSRGVYLGLRALCWVNDEPVWLEFQPASELYLDMPAPLADEVAIVMRRVGQKSTLEGYLSDTTLIGGKTVTAIAKSVVGFHKRSLKASLTSTNLNPVHVAQLYHERYVEELQEFNNTFGSFLDPFSQIELSESVAYLGCFLAKNENLIKERARRGFIIDSHGDLRATNIGIDLESSYNRSCYFFNRPIDLSFSRVDDFLSDLASLAIDLEVKDQTSVARQVELAYNSFFPEVMEPELYRFHLVAQALRQARNYFESFNQFSTVAADVNRYFSRAFKYALNLTVPFIIAIVERGDGRGRELAASLAELLEFTMIDAEAEQERRLDSDLPRPLLYDRLLGLGEDFLAQGKSVVVLWDFMREEEIYDFRKFCFAQGHPSLFVQCEGASNEKPLNFYEPFDDYLVPTLEVDKIYPYWAQFPNDATFSYVRVGSMVTGVDTPLYIVQQLRQVIDNAKKS